MKREHFRKASGKIIRAALSQLEHAELVVKTKEGRKISPKGQSLLDNTAHEIFMKMKERYTPVWIRKPIAAAEGEEEESQT